LGETGMTVGIITGSGGLIGAETVKLFADRGLDIVGIDNDMRSHFFGPEASTYWQIELLKQTYRNYVHVDSDVRDETAMRQILSNTATISRSSYIVRRNPPTIGPRVHR
jgi:CDP-paratose 2-epimerase